MRTSENIMKQLCLALIAITVVPCAIAGNVKFQVTLSDARGTLPQDWHGEQAYSFDGLVAGKPQKLTLVPFADARSYRMWLMRPE